NNDKNQDYVAYAQLESRVCVMLFQVRAGKIVGRESYNISEGGSEAAEDILKAFMLQYYSGSAEVPKEIYLSESFEDVPLYAEWLTRLMGYKVQVTVPVRGEKRRMIELVERNAKEYILKFQEKIEQDNRYRSESEQELRDLLGMPENLSLRRIEAYDISNIGGVYTVGSMVVFEDGKKKRSDYRRYRVKSIIGQNDYGAMQEVLFRRFRRGLEEQKIALETGVETMKFSNFPDLILIDGGKGHVNAVLEVLGALNLYIPVAGMVKDDFHRTDDLYYEETLCGLKEKRQAFRFVSEIQEEVHRFAIEYHRSLRSKEMTQSLLDEIEGIGPKRRAALLKHFKSIEAIKEADVEALSQVKGMSKSAAESVYQFFYKKSENSDSVIS
ncbi:MAG: excinuclease subunit, partial [Clostridiales bacterium]|nr:excinuclease subunit [Clostridiales bacterium]